MNSTPSFGDVATSEFDAESGRRTLPDQYWRSTMMGKMRKCSTEKSCFDDHASFSSSINVVTPLRLFLSATVAFSCESRSPMKGNEDDGETVKALRKGPTRV